jgi:hypothetical protein
MNSAAVRVAWCQCLLDGVDVSYVIIERALSPKMRMHISHGVEAFRPMLDTPRSKDVVYSP